MLPDAEVVVVGSAVTLQFAFGDHDREQVVIRPAVAALIGIGIHRDTRAVPALDGVRSGRCGLHHPVQPQLGHADTGDFLLRPLGCVVRPLTNRLWT